MKRWNLLILLAALWLLCFSSNANTATITMSLCTDDDENPATPDVVHESPEIPLYYVEYDNGHGAWHVGYPADDPRYNPDKPGYEWATEEGAVYLKPGKLDPDPLLSFAGFAIDFGAPSNFSFTFMMPLIPTISNPSFVSDSFSYSVTNGPAAGGVTVTPLPPPPGIPEDGDGDTEIQVYTLFDSVLGQWVNVGLDQGTGSFTPLGPNQSGLGASYNSGPIPTVAGGPWTFMRADINFRLSGGSDIMSFNGAKVLVPEPGTILLSLLALVGFGLIRRPGR